MIVPAPEIVCLRLFFTAKFGLFTDQLILTHRVFISWAPLVSYRSSAKLRFGRARAHLGLPAALLGPSGPDSESSNWDPYDDVDDLVEATRLTLRNVR